MRVAYYLCVSHQSLNGKQSRSHVTMYLDDIHEQEFVLGRLALLLEDGHPFAKKLDASLPGPLRRSCAGCSIQDGLPKHRDRVHQRKLSTQHNTTQHVCECMPVSQCE